MYESQKRASKKWIENHREQFNALCRKNMKKYHESHRDITCKRMLKLYYWKKEQKIFLNILL